MAIRIVWVGCHSEGLDAFKNILGSGRRIETFITLDDDAFQKRSAGTRGYFELCEKYHVPVKLISSIKNEEAYHIIAEGRPDLLIVLGWSEILPERLLKIPTIGTVGAHASMLPHNRGSAPINWAIINGETECGNSLMWLDKEVDRGDIIDQTAFDISPYDTCATLYDKVALTNTDMLLRLIERLEQDLGPVMLRKNITEEPVLPRRRPKDGLVFWNQSGQKVYDFIRALTVPYPGAFAYLNQKKYYIWSASLLPGNTANECPGIILGNVYSPVEDACGIQVACKTGAIIIHELEEEAGETYRGRNLAEADLKGCFTQGETADAGGM